MAYAAAGAAIENQCYLAGVNRVGTDPDASYAGDSALVDFRGATLADAGEREQTLVAEFDSEAQAAFREEFPAWMDADGFELESDFLKIWYCPGMRYL